MKIALGKHVHASFKPPSDNAGVATRKAARDEQEPVTRDIDKIVITISAEASSMHHALTEKRENLDELVAMLERISEQNKEADSSIDDYTKCLQIALRIINGDRVPAKDVQFLAEKEPEMYANAMLLKRQNDRPKTFKSLLNDKKDDDILETFPSTEVKFKEQPAVSVVENMLLNLDQDI